MSKGTITTISFIKEKETKGAVRYQEVDDKGSPLEMTNGAKVGVLYFRKTAFADGNYPEKVIIDVRVS